MLLFALIFVFVFFCFYFNKVDFGSFGPSRRIGSLCTHIAHFTNPTSPDTVGQSNKDAWKSGQTFWGQIVVFETEQILPVWTLLAFSWTRALAQFWLWSRRRQSRDGFLRFYFDIFLKWRVLTFYITFNGNVCEAICNPLQAILYCHLDSTDSNDSSSAGSSLPQQTEVTGVMWVRIFNRLFMISVGSASSNKLCCYQVQCLSCVAAAGHLLCVQAAQWQVCSHMSNMQTMSHPPFCCFTPPKHGRGRRH